MKIETLKIKNFKSLHEVNLTSMPSFCVFVGRNGSGKTNLFQILAFLKCCLDKNVRTALRREGGHMGFADVVTREHAKKAIEIELQLRLEIAGKNRLVTYTLHIETKEGDPVISLERLRYKRGRYGHPYHFLKFEYGKGYAITNEEEFDKPDEELDRVYQKLTSSDTLAIKAFGQFERFKAAMALRKLIEQWHISDFQIDAARGAKDGDNDARHLSASGDNLPAVVRRLQRHHPERFAKIIRKMRHWVPGIDDIAVKTTEDGRLLMRYRDGAFTDPFIDQNVSDGTIKMFACLVLLHDPRPHPILCVAEPEIQLYHELMAILAEEFNEYASRGGQVLISTHSPQFLNAVPLDSIFIMEKHEGMSSIHRASEDKILSEQTSGGWHPGSLWKQGHFNGIANRSKAGL